MSSRNKSGPQNRRVPHVRPRLIVSTIGILTCLTFTAQATLPPWLQHVIGASTIEAALFRTMQLPNVQALYPRPPKEAQTELARLINTAPDDAQLYALRAQSDESALDFTAAEADWRSQPSTQKIRSTRSCNSPRTIIAGCRFRRNSQR